MSRSLPKIKICGLTREQDVECAVACGADCLGFVLYPKSPRFVSPLRLGALTRAVPAHVTKVGVVVNADAVLLSEAIAAGGLQVIQFHGEETPEQLAAFAPAVPWKALPLGDIADLRAAEAFSTEIVVVDAAGDAARGGTGKRCNWELAARLALTRCLMLAGGLNPANVAQAIQTVKPFGVDVSSGVEQAPGKKDHDLIRAFVAAVVNKPNAHTKLRDKK